jgi:type IV secretory pathway VirB3-like protein
MDVNEHERLFNFILRHKVLLMLIIAVLYFSYVIVFRQKKNICVFRVLSLKKNRVGRDFFFFSKYFYIKLMGKKSKV